jgi:hypothetical protein
MMDLLKIFKAEIIKVLIFLVLYSVTLLYSEMNRNDKTTIEFINKILNKKLN